jgi:hypothetical protein
LSFSFFFFFFFFSFFFLLFFVVSRLIAFVPAVVDFC